MGDKIVLFIIKNSEYAKVSLSDDCSAVNALPILQLSHF